MDTSSSSIPPTKLEPNIEAIKQRLLKKGVYPTPKIIQALRKKQIQKHNRKIAKMAQTQQPPPLTSTQKLALAEQSHFQTIKREYRDLNKAVKAETRFGSSGLLVGRPWERIESVKLRDLASGSKEFNGGKLKMENLRELKKIFEDGLEWILNDDIEVEEHDFLSNENQWKWDPTKRRRSDGEAIRFLVDRLSGREVTVRDWKLARIMKLSGLGFNEGQLLRIVEGLGNHGKWEQAMAVVEWVYNDKKHRDFKSRFVYTKLLSVLNKAKRPKEALRIFNLMREDYNIYPDMAAYHIISVALGQAGRLKELLKIIESMRQKPSKIANYTCHKNWEPVLEPDMVVYNSVLNACVPSKQWKGVSWVFEQLRKSGLKPNGATYGLAMEVMLHSGKYDLVDELFTKMNRSGEAPKAITYKVLVRALWEQGKVNEAVEAVRYMEQRGVVGTASVHYELACCLCNKGRWQDAVLEVKKMKKLRRSKPLEVTFTGMIMSSLAGGHINDCISIFEYMKAHCVPNIGTINIMLKVYGRNDLFSEAKKLFEEIKGADGVFTSLVPDGYTYSSMIEASASACQWEYFEFVYKELTLSGYQLDQCKHASLLVEASRAGKSHLLEHAFESTLEAGEIPHPSLFTEMVFQATARQNYERSVILVNAMAHAPFQITERQWLDLFEKNRDQIAQDNLEKLLDALSNSNVTAEPTVRNLSRSVQSLCGCRSASYSSSSLASGIEGKIIGNEKVELPVSCAIMENGNLEMHDNALISETDITHDEASDSDSDGSSNLEYGCNEAGIRIETEAFLDYEESGRFSDCLNGNLKVSNEAKFEMPMNQVDDSDASKLPSAVEILEEWKESRKQGGIYFPFQFGYKD